MNDENAQAEALRRQPGTNGIWTFIFIDMIVFLLLFFVFLSERFRLPAVFEAAQAGLTFGYGLANAFILLTSSLFMVEAVHAARAGDARLVRRNLLFCLGAGLLFSYNKIAEYGEKVAAGHGPASDAFYSFYYFITGAHFLHVVGGMVFIAHCWSRAPAEAGTESFRRKIENTGLFWHFVDLLWLFIFPLIYLAGMN